MPARNDYGQLSLLVFKKRKHWRPKRCAYDIGRAWAKETNTKGRRELAAYLRRSFTMNTTWRIASGVTHTHRIKISNPRLRQDFIDWTFAVQPDNEEQQ